MKIAFDLRRIKNPGIGRYMKGRCFRWENTARSAVATYRQAAGAGAEEAVCA